MPQVMGNGNGHSRAGEAPTAPPTLSYVLYARKSSESEERQVLSIDSQIKEMLEMAQRDGVVVKEIRRESHSAKDTGQRPVFNELIQDIRTGRFNAILTWAPDRLSRNAGDLGALVDLMDQKLLIEIRTYSQKFSNSPNEKFLLMILGSQAKLENDSRAINVKRGLRTRHEMGLWPGRAPIGYLNQYRSDKKCQIILDPYRAPVIKQMYERVAYQNQSGHQIFHWLKHELNFLTKGNKTLALSGIYRLLTNSFYYGVFECPMGSGHWYQGTHEPIIDKDLFDKVQAQIKRDQIVRKAKEFAFTKLMTCGHCGSGISAEEKYKKLKGGGVSTHRYYGCSRSRDRQCKTVYIREEDLIQELLKILDQVDLNELGMQEQLKVEMKRFHHFQRVLGQDAPPTEQEQAINIRAYAKYILKEGTLSEKRLLLSNLKSRLIYQDRKVRILS